MPSNAFGKLDRSFERLVAAADPDLIDDEATSNPFTTTRGAPDKTSLPSGSTSGTYNTAVSDSEGPRVSVSTDKMATTTRQPSIWRMWAATVRLIRVRERERERHGHTRAAALVSHSDDERERERERESERGTG
jgi:hypothetical protein